MSLAICTIIALISREEYVRKRNNFLFTTWTFVHLATPRCSTIVNIRFLVDKK